MEPSTISFEAWEKKVLRLYQKEKERNNKLDEAIFREAFSRYIQTVLMPTISEYTPVSTDKKKTKSGVPKVHARDMWQSVTHTYAIGNIKILGAEIRSEAPHAYPLEYGSELGHKPWPSASEGGQKRKRNKEGDLVPYGTTYPASGKTKEAKDKYSLVSGHSEGKVRVWAGGLSPGHGKTVGGPISNAIKATEYRFWELVDEIVKEKQESIWKDIAGAGKEIIRGGGEIIKGVGRGISKVGSWVAGTFFGKK